MGYRRTAATITLATSIVLLAALARGAQAPLPREAIDLYVRPLVDGEYCQAVVLGRVFGYGKKSAQDEARPDGDTVFEIGSATKVFTALLLVDMVRRGEVSLDDPVQKFLPDDVKVPKKGEQPITLDHLASHRSGLPRMPDNFTPKDPANPYADYSVKQMYEFLSRCQPAREAGEAFEYSNLGAGLLGHALARRAGKTYEALVVERICKPLGMSDTAVTLKQPTRSRLAPGHDAAGEPASNWDIPCWVKSLKI